MGSKAKANSCAPSLDLASRLTENAEIVSECLSLLQQLVPQLSAEERVLVATQHPYATPAWLDSLAALAQGRLSDDLQLIVDLERELTSCQVLASSRNRQILEERSLSRGEAGQGYDAGLAAVGESGASPVATMAAHAELPVTTGRSAAPAGSHPNYRSSGTCRAASSHSQPLAPSSSPGDAAHGNAEASRQGEEEQQQHQQQKEQEQRQRQEQQEQQEQQQQRQRQQQQRQRPHGCVRGRQSICLKLFNKSSPRVARRASV